MSELPAGWVDATLAEVAELPTRSTAIPPQSGDLPALTFRALRPDGAVDLEAPVSESHAAGKAMTRVQPGDAVLTAQGHVSGWVGKKVGLVREPAYAASTLQVVRPYPSLIDPRLLVHELSMHTTYVRLQEIAGARTSLSRKGFLSLPLVLPPLNEQRRIVAAIEEHLSRLDAADASLAAALRRLDALRASALEAVAPTEAPRCEVGGLAPPERKIAYGVLQPGPHIAGGVPLVRVGDLDRGSVAPDLKHISPDIAERYPRTRLHGGEVLLSLVGTIGRTAVAPARLRGANVARAVAVIPVRDDVSPEFVALALGRPSAASHLNLLSHEVARKTLNLEDVRRFEIPLPPLEEQRRIVQEVEERLSRIDALRASIERAQRRSKVLRAAILERAFRGELVAQDPSDEPAETLLARIRESLDS